MDPIVTLPASVFVPYTEGIFRLPEEIYHSPVKAPAISRGLVVELLRNSPAHAKAMIDGLTKKTVTKAMSSGTLVDKALLEPERFQEGLSHWVKPEGMKLNTKEGLAWKKDHPGPGEPGGLPQVPMDTDSAAEAGINDIKEMVESVMRHTTARAIVEQSTKQESAFCFDGDTGLLRKCRSDARMVDDDSRLVIADLKGTFPGGSVPSAWSVQCARMGYHIQDAFYSDIYRDLTGEKVWFLFIVVERKPPYAVQVFQIDNDGRHHAREKYKRALEDFRKCKETGIWPANNGRIHIIRLPRWELSPADPIVTE